MKKENNNSFVQDAIERLLDFTLFAASVLFLLVGIYAIVDNHLVVRSADIPEDLKKSSMADKAYPDIDDLQKKNAEIVAWLYLEDTMIDYPITQSKDNVKYLTIDYKNEYSVSGNPFVDFRNSFLNDDFTIIYGHRMNQKKMFGSLIEYNDASYFQKHRKGAITTKNGTFALEAILYTTIDINKTKVYDLVEVKNNNNQKILDELAKNAVVINGDYPREELSTEKTDDWRLLLLSTCDKDARHYRDILLLRIGEEL